jgi:hypothetical protein
MGSRRNPLGADGLGAPLTCGIPIGLLPSEAPPAGGGGAGPKPADPKAKEKDAAAAVEGMVSMTQERLNGLLAREKDQGQRGALSSAAEAAGFGSFDDLLRIVAEKQKQDLDAMSDLDRKKAETETARREALKLLEDAKDARFAAVALKILQAADAQDGPLAAAALLGGGFGLTPDSDEAAIEAAVGKLKDRAPGLFAPKTAPPATGDPGKPPAGAKPGGVGVPEQPGSQKTAQLERIQRRRPGVLPAGVHPYGSGPQ